MGIGRRYLEKYPWDGDVVGIGRKCFEKYPCGGDASGYREKKCLKYTHRTTRLWVQGEKVLEIYPLRSACEGINEKYAVIYPLGKWIFYM